MKYINIDANQNLRFDEIPKPTITPSQCLIKVHAIGVNRADLLQRAGKYPPPPGESDILGLEVSGCIVERGANVSNINVGDRVCGLVAGGGYAQYVAIHKDHIIPLPEHYSYQQGAALSEVYLTAYQSLFTIANLQQNEHVLIHGGGSGVGSAAIMLAKAIGARVTVTVSNQQKAEACTALGADHSIIYTDTDFVHWAKQHQPSGYNVIIDIVAGDYVNKNINVLAVDGRIVILSMLQGRYSEPVDIAKLLQKRATIQASTLRNRSDHYKAVLVEKFKQDFYPALSSSKIKPLIDTEFSWHDADKAHQLLAQNANIGKYILTVDD